MRQSVEKKASVVERLIATGEVHDEPPTEKDIALWMAQALSHPPHTLSEHTAASSIAELWSARFVSGTGRTVSELVVRELRSLLGSHLQSDAKRRRWRLTLAGRQRGVHENAA